MALTELFMQSFDKFMIWWKPPKKSRIPQRPTSQNFEYYMDSQFINAPELFYERPQRVPIFSNQLASKTKHYELYKLECETCTSSEYKENNKIHLEYFKVKQSPKVLLTLHGWGLRKREVEKTLSEHLAKQGISSIVIILPYHMERAPLGTWSGEYFLSGNINRTIEAVRQTVTEISYLINFFKEKYALIGLYGPSLGGILAHIAMAAEDRLDFGISVLAGGNPAGVVWDGLMTQYVRRDIELAGLSRQELEKLWQVIDPATLPCKLKKDRLLMINGKYDQIIPPIYSQQLWEHLDHPEIIWYPCAHYSMYFFIQKLFRDISDFIKAL